MAEGGAETVIGGKESIPELRAKVLKRLEAFTRPLLATEAGKASVLDWFGSKAGHAGVGFGSWRTHVKATLARHSSGSLKSVDVGAGFQPSGTEKFPYFGFIPPYLASVIPDAAPVSFSTPCFRNHTVTAATAADGLHVELAIVSEGPTSLTWADTLLLGTASGPHLHHVFLRGRSTVRWSVPAASLVAERWDLRTKGIRVFRFLHDPVQLVEDLLETVLLFLEPVTKAAVSPAAAQRNLYFLEHYAQLKPDMAPRTITDVDIDEADVHSGDFFGIVRLDGLDPMLAWAMGSTTGHTTTALRHPNGTLYIAESTVSDAYWPTNGIQITPFRQWLDQAKAADFNLVHAPLAPKYREKYNATAAWEFFESVRGLDYGYHNMLWSWIDLRKDNYPCLPPDYAACLSWEHFELVASWVDKLVPTLGDLMFNEAFNLRLGTTGLKAADLLMAAGAQGLDARDLPAIPERDEWKYHTTRDGAPAVGESMVCCVFVCHMWKSAGIFDEVGADRINCGEFTNFDVYSMNVFDAARSGDGRPAQCRAADPSNPLCQLRGKYTLQLNGYNSRHMAAHMAERCPSEAPLYTHPDFC